MELRNGEARNSGLKERVHYIWCECGKLRYKYGKLAIDIKVERVLI